MKTISLTLPLTATILALVAGCSNPADNVTPATVSSDAPAKTAEASDTKSLKKFVFGPEGSKVEFIGSKVTGSHNGGFKKFEGELFVGADGQLADAGNKVTIDTTSIWSDNDRLTGHLK